MVNRGKPSHAEAETNSEPEHSPKDNLLGIRVLPTCHQVRSQPLNFLDEFIMFLFNYSDLQARRNLRAVGDFRPLGDV